MSPALNADPTAAGEHSDIDVVLDGSPKDYYNFFFQATQNLKPYPYQIRLGTQSWPTLLNIPTGAGKTAAIAMAWLYKVLAEDPHTPNRLVYCLPMRTLVNQTVSVIKEWVDALSDLFREQGRKLPSVNVVMGGELNEEWARVPEHPAVLVGTQDMLLSRALNRGYGASRFRWPLDFGIINNNSMWVLDETQLMGVAVETSAQLAAFRSHWKTFGPSRTLWMSATLGREQIITVDHPEPEEGFSVIKLSEEDKNTSSISKRYRASKKLSEAYVNLSKANRKIYPTQVAQKVFEEHRSGLTLVIVNRVERAQQIYKALSKKAKGIFKIGLVHSRFREADRKKQEVLLWSDEDRVIVATQAVEAGVDISARTMFTEAAPYPSLVQRFGRCNRAGEFADARVFMLNIDKEPSNKELSLPYLPKNLIVANSLLIKPLFETEEGVSSENLDKIIFETPEPIRPVLRKKDFSDLFDTTPDLCGNELDISRFIRDTQDNDVQVYFRDIEPGIPPEPGLPAPARDEVCRVSLSAFTDFLKRLHKYNKKVNVGLSCWWWDGLDSTWVKVRKPRPEMIILIPACTGGYDPELGWTGQLPNKKTVKIPVYTEKEIFRNEGTEEDFHSLQNCRVTLSDHLGHVVEECRLMTENTNKNKNLGVQKFKKVLEVAARWHDVGKAHPCFQKMLDGEEEKKENSEQILWAKSELGTARCERRFFRHELVSALMWLKHNRDTGNKDKKFVSLVAFLIAAHHGKVRLSVRSLPDEPVPPALKNCSERLYARGVWEGDKLPEIILPDGFCIPAAPVDLSPMLLGEGSYTEGVIALIDDPDLGPFRLSFLEAILRLADWRGSAAEEEGKIYE